jgi:hypothetical protein
MSKENENGNFAKPVLCAVHFGSGSKNCLIPIVQNATKKV